MPLDPQAARFLKTWEQLALPPLEATPIEQTRATLATAAAASQASTPPLASIVDEEIAGPGGLLHLRIYTPHAPASEGVCLYFHGGGWVFNSVDTHDDLVRCLAAGAGCVFVSVDYRLAPEHPYPAAVEDGYAAVQWCVSEATRLGIDASRIAVAGDSAGGNIAAALCLMTRDRGGPGLVQQVLIYPIVDCDLTRPSYVENAEGYFLTTSHMQWYWDQYCPNLARRREPYASPIRGSLADLPPALVLTAEFDPLRDEAEAYVTALQSAGVAATLRRFPGMIHAFARRLESFTAAREAVDLIAKTLRDAFDGPHPAEDLR